MLEMRRIRLLFASGPIGSRRRPAGAAAPPCAPSALGGIIAKGKNAGQGIPVAGTMNYPGVP
jgi:hypothetical protein